MVNRHRGEIEAILDGKSYRLCLTLGALAELEHEFGEDDMLAVAERFEAGRIAARDAIRMIGAGLRGAGYDLDDDAVINSGADPDELQAFVDTLRANDTAVSDAIKARTAAVSEPAPVPVEPQVQPES